MRPNQRDTANLKLLLDDEMMPEREAEFLDDLNNWRGEWTPRQAEWFDRIVLRPL